jgi:hypothetical protein
MDAGRAEKCSPSNTKVHTTPRQAREVGDPLRESCLQKLERSLPRCLGACWVVDLYEGVVCLVTIDLGLRFRLLERGLEVIHLAGRAPVVLVREVTTSREF